MSIFNFFQKKKQNLENEDLTKEEAEIAFQIAETAAIFTKSNFETAALLGGTENKDKIIQGVMPFAFGVLTTALELKGISWVKTPYVSIRFAEKFMPDAEDYKTIAAIILKLGMDDKYQDLRIAGQRAFIKFIEQEDDKSTKTSDLAKALNI